MKYLLELRNVSKSYPLKSGDCLALTHLSLQIEAGKFLVIKGPSGSGKTSLLNLCGLIDTPDEGVIFFNEQKLEPFNHQKTCLIRRRDIGFIFQKHQLIPSMTVFDNIAYPMILNKINKKICKEKVLDMLDKLDLLDKAKYFPSQLSTGQQQRVGIGRALIKRPLLVIADEPSASLDKVRTEACLDLMRELNQSINASFLIASHDDRVIKKCDQIFSLNDGFLS